MTYLSKPPKTKAPKTGDQTFPPSARTPRQTDLPHSDLPPDVPTNKTLKAYVVGSLAEFDDLPDSAHVRLPVVRKLYAEMSSASVWRNSGKTIPAPQKLTPGVTAWNVGRLRLALGIETKASGRVVAEILLKKTPRVRNAAAAHEQTLIESSSARSVKGDNDE